MFIPRLGYMELGVRVHSTKDLPKGGFERVSFPGLRIKIVHSRCMSRAREYLDIDVSFNEILKVAEILQISDKGSLVAYGLVELVTEKYRASFSRLRAGGSGNRMSTT